ncbi:histidine phosphatase family protein [Streptomyces sp. NPDC047061]|uniref:histidine phosphatase family protein n=1 Tax=Streptomyces sp. NPDC047061 TaxID=3154605 RepID=UPI0034078899
MPNDLTLLCAPGGDPTLDPLLGDAHLSGDSMRMAGAARAVLSPRESAVRAPSIRCSETADAMGLTASPEPMLRDLDIGRWSGHTAAEIAATDPDGFTAWLTDPDATPHDGESLRQLCHRSANWLGSMTPHTDHTLAITEAAVIRALLIDTLAIPARAFWHLTIPPLCAVFLTRRHGRWDVQFGNLAPHQPRRRLLTRRTTTVTSATA